MKSVLISTRPKWCEKICHEIGKEEEGKPIYEKRIEVRKTAPKEVPFKAYIYETKESKMRYLNDIFKSFLKNKSHYTDMGKVIGEFICDRIEIFEKSELGIKSKDFFALAESCVKVKEMREYIGENKIAYGWHISDLKIYDKPKELSEFRPICKFEGKDAICALFCPNWKYDGGLFFECTRKVDRPPQSWCYVEELCKAQN